MSSEEEVIVKTLSGSLRGRKKTSARKGFYYSFQGIPYAEPPVGDLRFKAPVPVKPWTGVRDALVEGPIAHTSSLAADVFKIDYGKKHDENCLFLNVYTPKTPNKNPEQLLPVMFWIHGGGFFFGSGDSDFFGPDYLITENIVLVTTNYRLGPLGFLSLQTQQCSGNNGLKDIIQALKWCQENISNFGGDPNNVTIFGVSAGGAAVHYLTLSKAAEGLFHRAIAQSGVSLNPWALSRKPRESAFKLGEALGCKTDNDNQLLEFLKKIKAEDLVETSSQIIFSVEPDEQVFGYAFTPCVEPEGADGAVLTMHPDDLYKSKQLKLVPLMIGAVTWEGLFLTKIQGHSLITNKTNLCSELNKFVPKTWNVDLKSEKGQEIIRKIEKFYFPNGYKEESLIRILSRLYFLNGINQVISYHQNYLTNPTYVYNFSYDGEVITQKQVLGLKDWKGTSHADDLTYLFKQDNFNSKFIPGTKDYAMMEQMTKMWTDFAKNGKPLPENIWPPISRNDLPYLDIDENLTRKSDLGKEEFVFWKNLYETA